MVSTCTNPQCAVPFLFLRQGKLFQFELSANDCAKKAPNTSHVERFWLCDTCVKTITLVMEDRRIKAVGCRTWIFKKHDRDRGLKIQPCTPASSTRFWRHLGAACAVEDVVQEAQEPEMKNEVLCREDESQVREH